MRGPYKKKPPRDRFWAKVDIYFGLNGCWLWTGYVNLAGYGRFDGRLAHRFAYEDMIGPVPDGLDIDHLCRVRNCVNPAHLEPVTRAENLRRGIKPRRDRDPLIARRNREKTHCPRGHEYTPENTYRLPSRPSARYCRACHRERTIERRA